MDYCFRVPGTDLRFGIDPLIGLVPGIGDTATAAVGLYTLWLVWKAGLPPAIIFRMTVNLLIDWLVGSIPVLGDLFDAGFKAHRRNAVLVGRHLQNRLG